MSMNTSMNNSQQYEPRDGVQRITIPTYGLVYGKNIKLYCDVLNNNFTFKMPNGMQLTFHADELTAGTVDINEFMPLQDKEITIKKIPFADSITILATDPRFRNAGYTRNLQRRYIVIDQLISVAVKND